MNIIAAGQKTGPQPARIPVLGEIRITTPDSCPQCGSRRKTAVEHLGWVCTSCFDRCKEKAEDLLEVGNGASRLRAAYAIAICSYRETYGNQT